LMAIGKHSHCSDTSQNLFLWHTQKINWSPMPLYLGSSYYYGRYTPIIWHVNLVVRGHKFIYRWHTSIIWHINYFLRGQNLLVILWQWHIGCHPSYRGTHNIFCLWVSSTRDFVTITCLTSHLISGSQIIFCANGAPYSETQFSTLPLWVIWNIKFMFCFYDLRL
jgi:hypothetical protein